MPINTYANQLETGETSFTNPSTRSCDCIDILSVDLLDQNRQQVNQVKELARSLKLEFGWHYLLDITWILAHLNSLDGKQIMDAGAGTGVMQWYLAEQGADVISVDRVSRADLPLRFRARFTVQGMRAGDLLPIHKNLFKPSAGATLGSLKTKIVSHGRELSYTVRNISKTRFRQSPGRNNAGRVRIYNQDLSQLSDIPDGYLDAVVAVSALEHNHPDELEKVIVEILRVLKPGGRLIATLGAARDQNWWHEPSSGWCYTEETLKRIFQLPENTRSNFSQYDLLLNQLFHCAELRDNLAKFYFNSGDNGMPWGKWDPQYQPVGLCKVKSG